MHHLLKILEANRYTIALVLLFVLIALIAYHFAGPAWDLIAHYLNARSYLSSRFLAGNFTTNRGWEVQYNTFYIEPPREATPSAIFALLIPLSGSPILLYIIALCLIFAVSVWFFGRHLNADSALVYSIMFGPFFIYFSLLANGTEVLSVSFLLLMLGLLYRKSPLSGIFMGLAGLSKFPNLIFLPLLLFLGDRKKIAVSYLLFAIVTIPFLVFNYAFYGNPFEAYAGSVSLNIGASGPIQVPLIPFLVGIAFPALMICFGLAHLKPAEVRKTLVSALRSSGFTKMASAFSVLAVVAYFIITLHTDYLARIRYAYLVYASAALFALIVLQKISSMRPALARNSAIFAGVVLVLSFAGYYGFGHGYLSTLNLNSNSSAVRAAIGRIDGLGYQGCRIESNAWVYLIYLNESAYSPLYLNQTVSAEYPIILFKNLGIAPSFVWNANSSRLVYSDSDFSIYLPPNAACVKD